MAKSGVRVLMKPDAPIRRFDVFAEYNRMQKVQEGMSGDLAKGYGLWLAKVVAARKFGRIKAPSDLDRAYQEEIKQKKYPPSKWRRLSGKKQTDKMFHKEIVARMGGEFYQEVFSPAIQKAFREGKSYVNIRDSIRRDWKP